MPFLTAWPSMLLIGAAHSTDHRVPALGYWTVLLVILAVDIARATIETKGDK